MSTRVGMENLGDVLEHVAPCLPDELRIARLTLQSTSAETGNMEYGNYLNDQTEGPNAFRRQKDKDWILHLSIWAGRGTHIRFACSKSATKSVKQCLTEVAEMIKEEGVMAFLVDYFEKWEVHEKI